MDGTSLKIFINDFFLALEGKELVEEKANANDFSEMEQEGLASKQYEESKNYYEKLVGGIETDSSLVEDKKDNEVCHQNIRQKLSIKNSEVKKVTKEVGVKTSTYFLSAFSYLLAKFGMDNESLFLTVHNGRTEDVKHSFGSYVKTYPLYTNLKIFRISGVY